ncbi:hypothetical protein AB1N83_008388 [Pleurotus pulmonarius]
MLLILCHINDANIGFRAIAFNEAFSADASKRGDCTDRGSKWQRSAHLPFDGTQHDHEECPRPMTREASRGNPKTPLASIK